MQTITDFFAGLGAWNWFVVAAVMMLLETVIPGVHFLWFGTAAVIIGFLVLAVPMPLAYQLLLFGLIAIATIYFARRRYAPHNISSDTPDLNARGQSYVGRQVTIVEPIENGRGKVSVGDTVWVAEGPDRPVGATVKVTGVNGTVLQVS